MDGTVQQDLPDGKARGDRLGVHWIECRLRETWDGGAGSILRHADLPLGRAELRFGRRLIHVARERPQVHE